MNAFFQLEIGKLKSSGWLTDPGCCPVKGSTSDLDQGKL
jgi:hypothetical protein